MIICFFTCFCLHPPFPLRWSLLSSCVCRLPLSRFKQPSWQRFASLVTAAVITHLRFFWPVAFIEQSVSTCLSVPSRLSVVLILTHFSAVTMETDGCETSPCRHTCGCPHKETVNMFMFVFPVHAGRVPALVCTWSSHKSRRVTLLVSTPRLLFRHVRFLQFFRQCRVSWGEKHLHSRDEARHSIIACCCCCFVCLLINIWQRRVLPPTPLWM